MIPRPPSIRQLPPVVTHPIDGIWEVVIPVARTNLITNPSFETGASNWVAEGGSIARTTTRQYYGAYSLAITPTAATTDGARTSVLLTAGQLYAYSAKVWAELNAPIKLAIETTGGVELASVTARGQGRWQWLYGYYLETSSTTRRLTLRKNGGTDTRIIYLDGVQVEALAAGETVSTYLDGDQLGFVPNQQPPAYYWNGTPHASTSTRSGLTRAGGMVVRFKDYGFLLLAIVGLGLAVPQNVSTEYARIDGGFDDYTRKPIRQFSIVGQFEARNYLELRALRGGLAQLLDRDKNAQDQRMLLRYHLENGCGDAQSDVVALSCKYQEGLGGQMDNHFAQAATITFTQYLPLLGSDNEIGASLNVQTAISNASRIAQRSAAGVWSNLSTGANSNVWALLWASDGKLYAGGEFTTIGGVAANRIAYWDGSAWNAMGTGQAGAGSGVFSIVEGPDGSIYAAGDGTGFGGVANTAGLARWNGSAWSSITAAGSANNDVLSLIFGPGGNLIAGGDFTTINGVAANRIASWDGTTWTAYGAGIASPIGVSQGIAISPSGRPVVAVQAGTVQAWSGSAWTTIGTADSSVDRVIYGPDGTLYAGGNFTTIGGISAAAIAEYNGVAWSPLGAGVDVTVGSEFILSLAVLPDGTLLAGGFFDKAGGITTVDNIARWNGSAWVYLDLDIAWSSVSAIAQRTDGTLTLGANGATTTGVAAATTTITNTGTARSYPTVVMKGPSSGTSRIYQISNTTTGRNIFLNYTINAGETARMVLQPDALSFTSDFQGNLAGTILPGSNEADFFLQPGANVISFFSADSTVTAVVYWRPVFASLDDVP